MADEVQTVEQKVVKFSVYKTKASLHIEPWLRNAGKVMLKIAPAVEGKAKGQPEKGSTQYDYDSAISISFSYQDLLKASFKLTALAYGDNVRYDKFADLSKIEGKDLSGQKKLSFAQSFYKDKKGEDVNIVSVQLSLDDKKLSIALDHDEIWALAKHFEYIYQFCLAHTLTGEINGG
jgi:hypothetical protein